MTSANTLANLHPATLDTFGTWRRAFERQRRKRPALDHSFSSFIEAGCDQDDLEWALFWVTANFKLSVEMPREIKDFFILVDTILPRIVDLRTHLDALLAWPSQEVSPPGFYLFLSLLHRLLPHLKIPQRGDRIRRIPIMLLELDLLLKAIRGMFKVNLLQLAASAASAPEVLLIQYVRKATRTRIPIDETLHQISSLVKLAFEAYGIKKGRQYGEETWGRRYRRFKKAERKKFNAIGTIVEDFLVRKSRGESVTLIPFFTDSYASVVRSEIMRLHDAKPFPSGLSQ